MEILLLALLLASSDQDASEWKNKLRSVLNFYKENRELISLLVQNGKNAPFSGAQTDAPRADDPARAADRERPSESAQKERPAASGQDAVDLFERYLRSHPI
ncbi:MAG: hypothetical protein ACI4NG_02485 [Candidatus Gallimonas sp.]